MGEGDVRRLIEWHSVYNREWDDNPELYTRNSVVLSGKSRRLGMYRGERRKAYLGVQHIDPTVPGWGSFARPETRFFLSFFVDGRVVILRTFPAMQPALDALRDFLVGAGP